VTDTIMAHFNNDSQTLFFTLLFSMIYE